MQEEVIDGIRSTALLTRRIRNLLAESAIIEKVFYVDTAANGGSDSNSGLSPTSPLLTIAAAITLSTTNKNDYIFVIGGSTADTEPITPTKATIHIIGLSASPIPLGVCLTASTDVAVFKLGTTAPKTEIAGFCLGGGGGHGGIDTEGSPYGLWIHNCQFGHEFSGAETPQYGIYSHHSPTGAAYCLIEDNIFYGVSGLSGAFGRIDDKGIYMFGAKGTVIRRNVFNGIPGEAIDLEETQVAVILDNVFSTLDAETGEAICLRGSCAGGIIKGNVAGNGMLNAGYTYNPFRDLNVNTNNTWSMNYRGNQVIEPVGV